MKMNRISYLILAAVLLMSLASFASVSAQPSLYALLHIANESKVSATVYYKWGTGRWRKLVIQKGESYHFPYRYDGQSRKSPDFFVRLDVDTQGVRYVEHILSRGQSPDNSSIKYGHHFTIKQLAGTNTRYIEATGNMSKVRVTDANSSKPDVD